jgi:hypothetical protein
MPSDATNRMTRDEWRALGFFYDVDDAAQRWRLVGSKAGLRRFAEMLRTYASNPKHAVPGEHDHFGPEVRALRSAILVALNER